MADDVSSPSPGDFLRAIVRRAPLLAAGGALAAGIAAVACAILPPTYESAATLQKIERKGILESIHSIDDFRRLVAAPEVLESAINEANATDLTPRALLASASTRPSATPNSLELALRHRDPQTAAALANALARLALERLERERRAVYDTRRRVLEDRLARLRADLLDVEADFGRWLEESQVDTDAVEMKVAGDVLRKLREEEAIVRAEAEAQHLGETAYVNQRLTSLRRQIVQAGESLRRRTGEHNRKSFEKERRLARYAKRREAYAGQELAYAEYLAEAHPAEPELIVRFEAAPPAAPTRAGTAAIVVSSAIAGLAASAFVAMVLGFRSPHG
jgi:hypothetical protein